MPTLSLNILLSGFLVLLGFGLQSFFGTKLILSVAQSIENCQEPRAGIKCLLRFTMLLGYVSFTCTFFFYLFVFCRRAGSPR